MSKGWLNVRRKSAPVQYSCLAGIGVIGGRGFGLYWFTVLIQVKGIKTSLDPSAEDIGLIKPRVECQGYRDLDLHSGTPQAARERESRAAKGL